MQELVPHNDHANRSALLELLEESARLLEDKQELTKVEFSKAVRVHQELQRLLTTGAWPTNSERDTFVPDAARREKDRQLRWVVLILLCVAVVLAAVVVSVVILMEERSRNDGDVLIPTIAPRMVPN